MRTHEHVQVQKVKDFPQTKLNSEIISPFLLNEHSDPRLFFQVFTENSLIKNIFEKEKRVDSGTGCILAKARTSRVIRTFNVQPVKIPHFKSLLTCKCCRSICSLGQFVSNLGQFAST